MTRLVVLGMGRMGGALTGRLLDGGFEVTIWNRSDVGVGAATEGLGHDGRADTSLAGTSR